MVAAIYKITNTVNGKVYIGKTVDLNRRWTQHRDGLRTGNHVGRTSRDMCADAAVHGHLVFEFEVLQQFDIPDFAEMDQAEIRYLLEYQSIDPSRGYNRSSFSQSSHKSVERMRVKHDLKERRRVVGFGRNRIEQYDISGTLVAEWPSFKVLTENLPFRITRQGLQQASKDMKFSYKGFRWKMIPCKK